MFSLPPATSSSDIANSETSVDESIQELPQPRKDSMKISLMLLTFMFGSIGIGCGIFILYVTSSFDIGVQILSSSHMIILGFLFYSCCFCTVWTSVRRRCGKRRDQGAEPFVSDFQVESETTSVRSWYDAEVKGDDKQLFAITKSILPNYQDLMKSTSESSLSMSHVNECLQVRPSYPVNFVANELELI